MLPNAPSQWTLAVKRKHPVGEGDAEDHEQVPVLSIALRPPREGWETRSGEGKARLRRRPKRVPHV